MRTKLLLIVVISLGYLVSYAQPAKPIPGQYIVILKESAAIPLIKQLKQTTDRLQNAKDSKADDLYIKLDNMRGEATDVFRKIEVEPPPGGREDEPEEEEDDKSVYIGAVCGFTAKLTSAQATKLQADPDVQGVYQDYQIKPSPAVHGIAPPDVQITSQYTPCAVTTAGGSTNGSAKITWIWFIGSGIDGSHPDLNVQTNPPFAISFVPGESWNDNSGQGTHIAGIAAAKNNNIGIVGVSAGAKVVPVKVLNSSGIATWSSILAALNHVAMHNLPGDVVCLPLGGREGPDCYNCNPAVREAINNLANAGLWIIISSGNEGGKAEGFCPGCTNGNRIFTVGSISCAKTASIFSNFSPTIVDWVAVGEEVYSTLPGGKYGTMSGTDMTVPVVAGIIHSKGAAPVSGGTVNCRGTNYRIAHR